MANRFVDATLRLVDKFSLRFPKQRRNASEGRQIRENGK